jgi:hypothetical protein
MVMHIVRGSAVFGRLSLGVNVEVVNVEGFNIEVVNTESPFILVLCSQKFVQNITPLP